MDFGRRFRYFRKLANLTQKEAAEKLGVKDYQLGNYETNRSEPSLETLKKMSKVYDVSLDGLLGNMRVAKKFHDEMEKSYVDINKILQDLTDYVEQVKEDNKNK